MRLSCQVDRGQHDCQGNYEGQNTSHCGKSQLCTVLSRGIISLLIVATPYLTAQIKAEGDAKILGLIELQNKWLKFGNNNFENA